MGNTAVIIIDTDRLRDLESPEFGTRLRNLINAYGHHHEIGAGARVVSLSHTTDLQIVAVQDRFGAYVSGILKRKQRDVVSDFLDAERAREQERRNG